MRLRYFNYYSCQFKCHLRINHSSWLIYPQPWLTECDYTNVNVKYIWWWPTTTYLDLIHASTRSLARTAFGTSKNVLRITRSRENYIRTCMYFRWCRVVINITQCTDDFLDSGWSKRSVFRFFFHRFS